MSELTKGREFQLWEYHVSHGSLLIRSPAGPKFKTSIDIICVGVDYLSASRHLGEIFVSTASDAELRRLEEILGKKIPPSRVWLLKNLRERALIVAAELRISEFQGDIFDSPFKELR
jgi:hypothetical protein